MPADGWLDQAPSCGESQLAALVASYQGMAATTDSTLHFNPAAPLSLIASTCSVCVLVFVWSGRLQPARGVGKLSGPPGDQRRVPETSRVQGLKLTGRPRDWFGPAHRRHAQGCADRQMVRLNSFAEPFGCSVAPAGLQSLQASRATSCLALLSYGLEARLAGR